MGTFAFQVDPPKSPYISFETPRYKRENVRHCCANAAVTKDGKKAGKKWGSFLQSTASCRVFHGKNSPTANSSLIISINVTDDSIWQDWIWMKRVVGHIVNDTHRAVGSLKIYLEILSARVCWLLEGARLFLRSRSVRYCQSEKRKWTQFAGKFGNRLWTSLTGLLRLLFPLPRS